MYRFENIDLALQVLEELGSKLLSRYRLDSDWYAALLCFGTEVSR